ncbi:hypothetical protein CC79DRAFT_1368149 [Sarocladium strictum]
MSQIEQNNNCQLPAEFTIQDFDGKSNDTGKTLSSFNFTFRDDTTKVNTLCQFNSSSVSTTPGGLQGRFACEDGETKFIWEDDEDKLWMIERVCLGESGSPMYETAGSIDLHLDCNKTSNCCRSNATEATARFASVSPIRDPTLRSLRQRRVMHV